MTGAGTGALTAEPVRAGAYVIAIELHPDRVAVLRQRFTSGVRVVRADASDLRLPRRPFKVVANPPFGVTSALLLRLVHLGSRLIRADLVVQEQAARRWTGDRAPAARRWQQVYRPTVGRHVPREAFSPRPHVTRECSCSSVDERASQPGAASSHSSTRNTVAAPASVMVSCGER